MSMVLLRSLVVDFIVCIFIFHASSLVSCIV